MPGHHCWLCLCSAIVLAGCQSANPTSFSWRPLKSTDPQPNSATESLVPQAMTAASARSEDKPAAASSSPAVSTARLDELVAQGIQSIQENQLSAAAESFNAVLKLAPDNATAHHGLAMIADLGGHWSDAEYHYKQALRSRPRDAGLLNDLGYSYLLQQRFHEASRYLSQAIEQNPQHEKAHENLAMLSLRQGDRAGAEQRLQLIYPSEQIPHQLQLMESQIRQKAGAANTETRVADALPELREGASFEEVRALAEQQRKLAVAERQRRHAAGPATPEAAGRVLPAVYPGTTQSPQPSLNDNSDQMTHTLADSRMAASGSMPTPQHNQPGLSSGGMMQQNMTQFSPTAAAAALLPQSPVIQSPMVPSPGSPSPVAQVTDPRGSAPLQIVNGQYSASSSMAGQRPESGRALAQPTGSVISIQPGHASYPGTAVASTAGSSGDPGSPGQMPAGSVSAGGPGSTSGSATVAASGAPFPLAGLNAGPGTLFPVSSSQTHRSGGSSDASAVEATPASISSPAAAGPSASTGQPGASYGGQNMAAGANPPIHATPYTHGSAMTGSMFPQTASVLPVQQVAVSSTTSANNGMGYGLSPAAVPAMGAQPSVTSMSPHVAPGYQPNGSVTAPNPMEAYDRQLQQLNTEYQQSLQQFGRTNSGLQPVQAQYD